MRRVGVLAAMAMLAACGGNSEDFTLDVAMGSTLAKAELAQLDGGEGLRALSLPLLMAQADTAGELTFTIPGEDDGTLHLRFEDIGQNSSRIHVALDLPFHTATVDGKTMLLDEDKAEKVIQERLAKWAEGHSQGYASLAPLNEALTGISLAMMSDEERDKLDLSGAQDAMRSFAAEESGQGTHEQFAEAGDLAGPMDSGSGDWNASRPMDDTSGMADAARPMDDASGDEPEPEFGEPAY